MKYAEYIDYTNLKADATIDDIKNLCEYEIYGARKVKKVINDYLESKLIDKIIEGNNNIKIMSLKTEVR